MFNRALLQMIREVRRERFGSMRTLNGLATPHAVGSKSLGLNACKRTVLSACALSLM